MKKILLLSFVLLFDSNPLFAADTLLEIANHHPDCKRIQPFYLELGNSQGIIKSAQIGGAQFDRSTVLPIASASKWVFAAYVAQRLEGQIDEEAIKALTMQSGYTQFKVSTCIDNSFETVEECALYGSNSQFVQQHQNRFFYNNGHQQKWAIDHGLGPMDKEQLSAELNSYLNLGDDLTFNSMQLAGGISLSAKSYAQFLSSLLNNQLHLSSLLGSYSTCTWGDDCQSTLYSPVELPEKYSLGHWIESYDGAFSSAGLFGFYPWINQERTHYGIISRFSVDFSDGIGYGPGYTSMLCGQALRKSLDVQFY